MPSQPIASAPPLPSTFPNTLNDAGYFPSTSNNPPEEIKTQPMPSAPPMPHTNSYAPDDDTDCKFSSSDEENMEDAVETAAMAREIGKSMIRDHLAAHLAQNPESSYVSWIATLHPENATVMIDPRFNIPGNPWLTEFEEGKQRNNNVYHSPPNNNSTNTPDVIDPGRTTAATIGRATIREWSYHGGIIDLTIGLSIATAGVCITAGLEMLSLIVYLLAVAFSKMLCERPSIIFIPLFGLIWLLVQVFRFLDMVILFVSVIAVESMAAVNALLCGLLSLSWQVGLANHQRTRRLAHLTRCACRRPFEDWNLSRGRKFWGTKISEEGDIDNCSEKNEDQDERMATSSGK